MRSTTSVLMLTAMGAVLSAHTPSVTAQSPAPASLPAPVTATETVVAETAPVVDLGTHALDVAGLRHSQILGLPFSHCGHVIDLLNAVQVRRQFGSFDSQLAFHLPDVEVAPVPGDVELLNVSQVNDGTEECGPMFQLTLRNCDPLATGSFSISLVGVLGQISLRSPSATVTVPGLAAGVTAVIRIQLPPGCMTMGLPGQKLVPFDSLVAVIDSFDELMESNELNNVRILNRSEIPLLVAATGDAVSAPAPTTPVLPPAVTPDDGTPGSPLDGIDLDSLGLDDADAQALLVR